MAGAEQADDQPADAAGRRGAHTLGPHVVGQRVVVRRVLPGQTGPSGGPAMTDVLGVCEAWGGGHALIRREDGSRVEILTGDIVSGKPVPPRPSRFGRLSVTEVARRTAQMFVPRVSEPLGDWLLRYTGGTNGRPNSVLPVGDPGVAFGEAERAVRDFYARRERRAWAQVVVGSPAAAHFATAGWVPARPDEADVTVQLAGVAQVERALRGTDAPRAQVRHADRVSPQWLVGNDNALANYPAVAASLDLPEAVFASIEDGDRLVARGRANLVGDWALLADLSVSPDRRREGLAGAVLADLVHWTAERGASVLALQVLGDNEPAQRLYASLGFATHHAYRYLAAPDSPGGQGRVPPAQRSVVVGR